VALMTRTAAAVLAAGVMLGAGACSSGPDKALVEKIKASGLTQEQAECIVTDLSGRFNAEQTKTIVDAAAQKGGDAAIRQLPADQLAAMDTVMKKCAGEG